MVLPFVIGILSLMGFPPTAGFFGKYMLFNRKVEPGTDNTDIYWVDAQIIETELKRDRFWAEGTAGIADRDVGGFVCANKIFQEADSYMI